MTIVNRYWNLIAEKRCWSTVKKKYCTCKRCRIFKCTIIKEVFLFIFRLMVILSVISYYIGDNFEEAEIIEDSEKRKHFSTMLIIGGLIGIYSCSTIHDNIENYNKRKEKLLNDLMEKGRIRREQWDHKTNNKRNAENYEKLYKFIINIFSVIPFIDGLYTSIVENGEECSFWIPLIIIMIPQLINVLIVSITTYKEIKQVEIKIDAVNERSRITGGTIKVYDGKVICKRASGSQTNRYEEITIKGGTQVAKQSKKNETVTIRGAKITIIGKKNQTPNSGGTTIIKSKNVKITTSKGELFYMHGTATIQGGTVTNNDEGKLENGTMVYEGGITTITGGTTKFTADSATIIGGEVKEREWKNIHITNYEGTYIEENPKCLLIPIVVVVLCNIACIGFFLFADNLQPLKCLSSSSRAIYWIRIIFLVCSIAAYLCSMIIAFTSWIKSKKWARKELREHVQREAAEPQELKHMAETQPLINT